MVTVFRTHISPFSLKQTTLPAGERCWNNARYALYRHKLLTITNDLLPFSSNPPCRCDLLHPPWLVSQSCPPSAHWLDLYREQMLESSTPRGGRERETRWTTNLSHIDTIQTSTLDDRSHVTDTREILPNRRAMNKWEIWNINNRERNWKLPWRHR